jgi:hypothetical protein
MDASEEDQFWPENTNPAVRVEHARCRAALSPEERKRLAGSAYRIAATLMNVRSDFCRRGICARNGCSGPRVTMPENTFREGESAKDYPFPACAIDMPHAVLEAYRKAVWPVLFTLELGWSIRSPFRAHRRVDDSVRAAIGRPRDSHGRKVNRSSASTPEAHAHTAPPLENAPEP